MQKCHQIFSWMVEVVAAADCPAVVIVRSSLSVTSSLIKYILIKWADSCEFKTLYGVCCSSCLQVSWDERWSHLVNRYCPTGMIGYPVFALIRIILFQRGEKHLSNGCNPWLLWGRSVSATILFCSKFQWVWAVVIKRIACSLERFVCCIKWYIEETISPVAHFHSFPRVYECRRNKVSNWTHGAYDSHVDTPFCTGYLINTSFAFCWRYFRGFRRNCGDTDTVNWWYWRSYMACRGKLYFVSRLCKLS